MNKFFNVTYIFFVFFSLCIANDNTDYYCPFGKCSKLQYMEYRANKYMHELAFVSWLHEFVPTDEMYAIVDKMDDPTERMLNHTFWRMTTVDEVHKLIQAGADLSMTAHTSLFLDSELHILDFALHSGQAELVWAVLNASPDTSYRVYGYTPLMLATAFYDDLEIYKRIIELGSDPSTLSEGQFSSALSQLERRYLEKRPPVPLETRKYLLSLMSSTSKLFTETFWILATKEDVLQEIENGADVNFLVSHPAGYDYTPLWYAISYSSNYESIQALINAGAHLAEGNCVIPNPEEVENKINFLTKNGIEQNTYCIDKPYNFR